MTKHTLEPARQEIADATLSAALYVHDGGWIPGNVRTHLPDLTAGWVRDD
jgi:acetyl esterase/lipase